MDRYTILALFTLRANTVVAEIIASSHWALRSSVRYGKDSPSRAVDRSLFSRSHAYFDYWLSGPHHTAVSGYHAEFRSGSTCVPRLLNLIDLHPAMDIPTIGTSR